MSSAPAAAVALDAVKRSPFPPDRILLPVAAVLYTLLFALFWPQSYTTMDEADYMGMAYVVRQGTFYPDVAGVQVITAFPVGQHMVSKYPPGMFVLLALFSLPGWSFALAANLVIHLLTFYVVALILRRIQVPAALALLYLFHPTAVIYSRTAMSDLPTGLCLAAAFYLLLCRRFALCGGFIGLALLFRNANAVALPVFVVGSFFAVMHAKETHGMRAWFLPLMPRLKQAGAVVLGALPGLTLLLWYTAVVQGGSSGLSSYSGGGFNLANFLPMFATYALRLSIIYPLMLAAPLLYRGEGRLTLAMITSAFVLLYSFWYFTDATGSPLESFVIGLRFMLAVLPLFLVAYAWVLWDMATRWQKRRHHIRPAALMQIAGGAVLLFLIIGSTGIHFMHDRKLGEMVRTRTAILRIVPPGQPLVCNMPVAKLFHPGLARRDFFMIGGNEQDNLRGAAERFRAGLKGGGGGAAATLAVWVRGYREEAAFERKFIESIGKQFILKPVTGAERQGLPEEVQIFRVVGERPNVVRL